MNKLKLNIQMFSGGSYDYKFYTVDEYYNGKMYDLELNDLINDLIPLLKSVEWWQSGDTNEEDYRKDIDAFKKKWFETPRRERLKKFSDYFDAIGQPDMFRKICMVDEERHQEDEWLECKTLDDRFFYMNMKTGEELPYGVQPIKGRGARNE